MRYCLTCIVLLFLHLNSFAQKTQEYIITLSEDTLRGKITFGAVNLIHFKEAGSKKEVAFRPFEIKGYFNESSLKLSKIDKTIGSAIFAYHYRPQEDFVTFQHATGMVVPQRGKINLYYKMPTTGGVVPSGIGYTNTRIPGIILYELADSDDVYSSDIYSITVQVWNKQKAIHILANLIQDNPSLYEEVISMKGKFNIKYVSGVIQKYNAAHAQNTSGTQEVKTIISDR